jgi:diadenosine tetraphosphate (Ap4A) HIT family hydrolase
MNCEFCDNPNSEHLKYKIKEYQRWTVYLWKHPYHLGRCFMKLNRHAEDFFDINDEEKKELFVIGKKLRGAIKDVFGADMLNYAALGNIVKHVHLHFIPRYSKEMSFESIIFKDENCGRNYAPHDKNFDIPVEIKKKILEEIRLKLEMKHRNLGQIR